MLERPVLLSTSRHPDVRGTHDKFFGDAQLEELKNFPVREVYMTTSHRNVVRGMHVQTPAQPKIIQVLSGSIQGNILCCNPLLENDFGKAVQFRLSASDQASYYVPGDWSPSYRALEDNTQVLYLAAEVFVADGNVGIDPFDPELNLYWGEDFKLEDAIQNERDKNLQSFRSFTEGLSS